MKITKLYRCDTVIHNRTPVTIALIHSDSDLLTFLFRKNRKAKCGIGKGNCPKNPTQGPGTRLKKIAMMEGSDRKDVCGSANS